MRIAYLWDADYPWDVRTQKVCAALTRAGHEVVIVARNKAWDAERERLPEGEVRRMRPVRALGRRLDVALGFPAFFNPRWIGHLDAAVQEAPTDLIIVRDLPLCPTALFVGRRRGVPVMLDMAENYAAMIRETWDAGLQRPLDVLVRNPSIIAAIERWCVARVDHILTVVEESSTRVAALGVPASRMTVVSNTPPRARARAAVARRADGPLEVVYLGLMEVARGVAELTEAAALLRDRGVPVRLQLIGGGRDLDRFRARAAELGLGEDVVRFHGFVPNAEALRLVAQADVGVVPHHADESWNTTIPNKLFDYMAAGLAVVTSDAVPAARVVRQTAAGLVFRSGDASDLASALEQLADEGLRARSAAHGTRAILDRYHWERDVDALLGAVHDVAGRSEARRSSVA